MSTPNPFSTGSANQIANAIQAQGLQNGFTQAIFNAWFAGLPSFALTSGEIAAGVTPVNFSSLPGYLSRYAVNTTPGTTDMSAGIMAAINANLGGRVYIDTGVTLAAGIIMTGSSYNGTEIYFVNGSEILLKPNLSGGTTLFNFDISIWVGIAVQGCDRVRIVNPRFNGNRANMAQYEGAYCIAICGSTNCVVESPVFREIRGDGLYIDWYAPHLSTGQANSSNIYCSDLLAYNSATDGRNACSIISCAGCVINGFESFNVGGTINSQLQPGGLDLEPDWPAQVISDVVVSGISVITAGGSGIAVSGMSTSGNDTTQDWNINRVQIVGRLNHTAVGSFLLERCWDTTAKVDIIRTGAAALTATIDYVNRCDAELNIANSSIGVWLGANGFVTDSVIRANVNGYGSTGFGAIMTSGIVRTTIRGKIYGAATGNAAPAVLLDSNGRSGLSQTYTVYSVDFPFDSNANSVINNSGITIGAGTCLKDCTMLGWATALQATFQIPSYNCAGRNYGTGGAAAPTNGTWAQFDETVLDQSAGATAPRAKCITGGSPGTWKTYGVLST